MEEWWVVKMEKSMARPKEYKLVAQKELDLVDRMVPKKAVWMAVLTVTYWAE